MAHGFEEFSLKNSFEKCLTPPGGLARLHGLAPIRLAVCNFFICGLVGAVRRVG